MEKCVCVCGGGWGWGVGPAATMGQQEKLLQGHILPVSPSETLGPLQVQARRSPAPIEPLAPQTPPCRLVELLSIWVCNISGGP